MSEKGMTDLRAALDADDDLRARFQAATTEQEVLDLAREAGVVLDVAAVSGSHELSEGELEVVSGGYTFPPTDWIYCDNPWTNVWCTGKC